MTEKERNQLIKEKRLLEEKIAKIDDELDAKNDIKTYISGWPEDLVVFYEKARKLATSVTEPDFHPGEYLNIRFHFQTEKLTATITIHNINTSHPFIEFFGQDLATHHRFRLAAHSGSQAESYLNELFDYEEVEIIIDSSITVPSLCLQFWEEEATFFNRSTLELLGLRYRSKGKIKEGPKE